MSETIEWLGGLEGKVREAARRLQALRQENRKLASQVQDLESRLAVAEAQSGTAADGPWQEERAEIRRRVESLTATLEELIDEDQP